MTDELRAIARRQLPAMYRPDDGVFAFTLRDAGGALVAEGRSPRYTSIVLIGLAAEDAAVADQVLHGQAPGDVCARMVAQVSTFDNPGDVALLCWAAHAWGVDAAPAWARLEALHPETRPCAVVELAWVLSALAVAAEPRRHPLCQQVAARLIGLYNACAGVFPHKTSGEGGGRSHVACFADQVYPILALSQFGQATGSDKAVRVAIATATHVCKLQGQAGQWWWHYDTRTGDVIEGYPVYSVHQHAMAPMALRAVTRAGGPDFESSIATGMAWLQEAPEIGGRPLIDRPRQMVWRKVGRREPAKASRYLQALATRVRQGAAVPGLDVLFPPVAIDYECRPYEFGWFFYAWRDVPSAMPVHPVS